MPRAAKTVAAPRSDARRHLSKAEQFVEEARMAEKASRYDAAMLNAIHAGISAVDAVTIALGGRRSSDPDHRRAIDLLREVLGDTEPTATRANQLSALLGRKNRVEYESGLATAADASDAVDRAQRLVDWATEIVSSAGP